MTKVTIEDWGTMPGGEAVQLFTLKSGSAEARIATYGATLVSVRTADRNGRIADVVLGYDMLDGYLADTKTFMGGIVGRYGNRIANGRFSIDGNTYQLSQNDHGNTLHGGTVGFHQHLWSGRVVPNGVELTLVSVDGDMGFPGTLTATVTYTLTDSTLRIDYAATTDKATVVTLTGHAYFNLNGDDEGSILDHKLLLHADRYTPVNDKLIPSGELAPVQGTPFDFRKATPIGSHVDDDHVQLKLAHGYDHNWVVNETPAELKPAAILHSPASGRTLMVTTTEPGIQFYSGNFLDGSYTGRHGKKYSSRTGLCLETQHFPDSPNQPHFPTTTLRPGETLRSATTFTFGLGA